MDIKELRAHEHVDIERVNDLVKKIKKSKIWKTPIIIDGKTNIIMDGHHRVNAANIIGLNFIPCYIAEYSDDNLDVVSWETGSKINQSIIIDAVKKERLLPKKTTKHIFNYKLKDTNIPIDKLVIKK